MLPNGNAVKVHLVNMEYETCRFWFS